MSNVPYVVDENDQPVLVRVKGLDPSNRDAIYICRIEVWPGGRTVHKRVDMRPVTVGDDPVPPPDAEQVIEDRRTRGEEARQREAEALRIEKEARKQEEAIKAEKQRVETEMRQQASQKQAEAQQQPEKKEGSGEKQPVSDAA